MQAVDHDRLRSRNPFLRLAPVEWGVLAVQTDRKKKPGLAARLKNAAASWLDKLAKDNEKAFGRGGLDCCRLNRQKDK